MQNHKISDLVEKIKSLESELESELHKEYEHFTCEITKKREEILTTYRHERENMFKYMATAPILHLLSVPLIWACLIPAFFLDGVVSLYQALCFPIYKIKKVKRSEYIVVDRHMLGYLNLIEKLNCLYCSYFNGLMGYVSEIAGRTEQYWCPIRHGKMLKSRHDNYKNFFDYGDNANFRKGKLELREGLKEVKE